MASPFAQNSLEIANERKQEGNDQFRAGKWNEAIVAYRSALNCLPRRLVKDGDTPSPTADEGDDDEVTENPKAQKAKEPEVEGVDEVSSPAVSEAEKEYARLRAILSANIGACFVKLVRASYTPLYG